MIINTIDKIYNPKNIEESIYNFWEKSNYFEPDIINNYKKNYCIMMPPPNITGGLHLGHAFQQTIMDILVRYQRMNGKNVLWASGLDHAGIATQILIEKNFYNKKNSIKDNHDPHSLIKEVWLWKEKSEKFINYQIKRLGHSVSWKNKHFTMDPEISLAVKEAFIQLYTNNLIYKGKQLVNWDSKLQTAISDLEVSHKQKSDFIWYIQYQLEYNTSHINNQKKNADYLTIATTRPETILGDVAIAVNPEDPRYSHLIGKYVFTPITNRRIPIISDKFVNINKGTGCVKITPAHDFNDYIIGKKYKLPMINIFSTYKTILTIPEISNNQGQPYIQSNDQYHIPKMFHNLDYKDARKKIIEECKRLKILEDIKTHQLTVPINNRTGTIIEPMLTDQWFIKTKFLAKQAINAVTNEKIKFIPKNYTNIYLQWMNEIQDWCISRQIWWGHRIPVWYDNNNTIYVGHCEKDIRIKNQLNKDIQLSQDNNVLDTWFSSSLWTFSSLGWPKNNTLLKMFHPTNIIISGFDIIFFWIARMIMMTMYLVKDQNNNAQIPFKKIYITGLMRDKFGQKMSKSKGNGIDPIDIIDGISKKKLLKKQLKENSQSKSISSIIKYINTQFPNGIKPYGADTLRLTLTALASSGQDIHWDMHKLESYHNFCNKLWNVSKFVITHTDNYHYDIDTKNKKIFSLSDRWITSKLHQTIQKFSQALNDYRFDHTVNILYEFIWHQFCDWYIEFTKPILYHSTNTLQLISTRYTLITSLESILRLSHPIIPFITEKIWQKIHSIVTTNNKHTIMLQSFPKYDSNYIDLESISDIEWIQNLIAEIRMIRTYTGISYKIPLDIGFYNTSNHIKECISENYHILTKILQLQTINFLEKNDISNNRYFKIPIKESELIIFIPNIFDKKTAIHKFNKEIKLINYKIHLLEQKMNNTNYSLNLQHSFKKSQEKLNHYNKTKNKLLNQYFIVKNL
ncbi:valyl-tRNA synthetase [Candidatus Blochmanniella floridana]|uniref:Valine--tRNA ligase n=1 Tax=Blochmanniella floridana TaxID=203907 RepID=SYV_BLOFL|nr:RecName: Full=Valine--tRNA ligase; AltName: Full=Valyl-tRNA synthetase; Short=ValRS [Candidatus Blochmannia floridanus]CAD83561.1 valyl-tRNA synthetase [Candidatus Blochmannia floridanus]